MFLEHDLYGWQCRLVSRIRDTVRKAILKATTALGVLVFVDMGQGKTAPSLTAIAELMEDWLADCVLVVAPIKICEAVWRQEALKWEHTRELTFSLVRGNPSDRAFALARKANIYLVNPEHLVWLFQHLRGNFDKYQIMFVDESSLFKSPKSKRFKTIKKIRLTHYKLVIIPMTGTPRPNHIGDLWTQVFMVDCGDRLGTSYTDFQFRFMHKTKKIADHTFSWEEDEGAFEKIMALIADITIELSDDEKQKFPVVEVPHWIDLPKSAREVYDRLEKEMIYEWENSKIVPKHGGSKSIMLRQIAAGALYKNRLLSLEYDELHTEKLDYLKELLEELNRQVIITVEFKHDMIRLQQLLGKTCANFKSGNTTDIIQRWQRGDIGQLLMHPASAGFGLDGLQDGGATVIFFNETWSQQNYSQLIARLARTGQKADQVFAHGIRARDTNEVIMQLSRQIKGDEQTRFRKALRLYQMQKGLI